MALQILVGSHVWHPMIHPLESMGVVSTEPCGHIRKTVGQYTEGNSYWYFSTFFYMGGLGNHERTCAPRRRLTRTHGPPPRPLPPLLLPPLPAATAAAATAAPPCARCWSCCWVTRDEERLPARRCCNLPAAAARAPRASTLRRVPAQAEHKAAGNRARAPHAHPRAASGTPRA